MNMDTLNALLQSLYGRPATWTHTIIADIRDLQQSLPTQHCVSLLGDPDENRGEWIGYLSAGMPEWKGALRLYYQTLVRDARLNAGEQTPATATCADHHPCLACGKAFESSYALHGHMAKVHGKRNEARLYVNGTSCTCCLREFWTRERCIYHVKKTRCITMMRLHIEPISAAAAAALDKEAAPQQRRNTKAGRNPRFAELPAIRAQGPLQ